MGARATPVQGAAAHYDVISDLSLDRDMIALAGSAHVCAVRGLVGMACSSLVITVFARAQHSRRRSELACRCVLGVLGVAL